MPCYTTTTVNADVSKWNQLRAGEAIKEAGLEWDVKLVNGELVAQTDEQINKVKQAYAKLTLKAAATRFNWSVKSQEQTKKGLTQLNLLRR